MMAAGHSLLRCSVGWLQPFCLFASFFLLFFFKFFALFPLPFPMILAFIKSFQVAVTNLDIAH